MFGHIYWLWSNLFSNCQYCIVLVLKLLCYNFIKLICLVQSCLLNTMVLKIKFKKNNFLKYIFDSILFYN